ncbi:MAG: hypothetical protein IKS54_09145 [Erysipelotrichaceae bacterium]|nr:hypothetical protein [Erysipelotrichaceae bacterium]
MEEKYLEESVKEVVEDLKKKIDTLTAISEGADDEIAEKVLFIRDKAITVFNDVSEKLNQMGEQLTDKDEFDQAVNTIKARSKVLYENAMDRICELKKEMRPQEEVKPEEEVKEIEPQEEEKPEEEIKEETVEETEEKTDFVEEVKKSVENIVEDAGNRIDEFVNREDVRETVVKAKAGAVDIAEKTLEILKGWLMPDGEDQ